MVLGKDLVVGECYRYKGRYLGKLEMKEEMGEAPNFYYVYRFEYGVLNPYEYVPEEYKFDFQEFQICSNNNQRRDVPAAAAAAAVVRGEELRKGKCYALNNSGEFLGKYEGKNNYGNYLFQGGNIISKQFKEFVEIPCNNSSSILGKRGSYNDTYLIHGKDLEVGLEAGEKKKCYIKENGAPMGMLLKKGNNDVLEFEGGFTSINQLFEERPCNHDVFDNFEKLREKSLGGTRRRKRRRRTRTSRR